MRASRLFLALMVLIALACMSVVHGQDGTISAVKSNASLPGAISSMTSVYGQNFPISDNPISDSQAIYQAPWYLNGTVLRIVDENILYVDFANSSVPGMQGVTLILLPQSVSIGDLLVFQGKELSFRLLGHDILGRPVCQAYFEEIPIEYFEQYKRYEYHYYPNHGYYYSPGYGYYSPRYGYFYPGYGLYRDPSL